MPELAPSSPHAHAVADVARILGVSPGAGLGQAEASSRLARFGPNQLQEEEAPSLWRAVVRAATEPFVILLAAAGIGAVALGEVRDGLLVLGGLIPIVGADVATAYRSDRALAELRTAVAPRAHVLRDARRVEVPASELVPGDVLILGAGDVVPADARVMPGGSLVVDRSVLTGESVPEQATATPDDHNAALADRRAMVYAGTCIVGGRGAAVTVATGAATELGAIAGRLARRERRRSPLQRELDRLVRFLLIAAVALIVVTVGLGFVRGQPAGANVLAGISAAIAAIPEEPPILLAVILGLGAYRLMRRGVLVRRLAAQEALGAVDLIITDKTGTLTENHLVVEEVLRPDRTIEPAEETDLLLEALSAEEEAWAPAATRRRGSFTTALEAALEEHGVVPELEAERVVSSVPPGDGRPYAIHRHKDDDGWRELALGAPEAVARFVIGATSADWDPWERLTAQQAAAGGRLLLLAARVDGGPWRLRALIRFGDRLRAEVPGAVRVAMTAGIQTVIVTGDHLETATAVANAIGLPPGAALLGEDLDKMSDDDLASRLTTIRLVARATPEHKLRLVRVGQAHGRSIAVTGDGVNDAPALEAADVAVSMGSGTAVARGASDIVLGDDSFATMMHALREGRRIVANVQKGLVFLVSTHVALLGFILIATLAGFGQPLLPLQILWLELFIDLSTSVAFEQEAEEPGAMDRPPRPRSSPLLDGGILRRIAGAGGFSAICAFAILLFHPGTVDHARWMAFTTLVLAQVARAYANRSLGQSVLRLAPNRFLIAACLVAVAIQAAIPMIPQLSGAFRAVDLSAGEWLIAVGVAVAPALVAQAVRGSRRRVWVA